MAWLRHRKRPDRVEQSEAQERPKAKLTTVGHLCPDLIADIQLAKVTFRPDRSNTTGATAYALVEAGSLGRFRFQTDEEGAAAVERAYPDLSPAQVQRAVRLLNARCAEVNRAQHEAGFARAGQRRSGWLSSMLAELDDLRLDMNGDGYE